MYYSRVSYFVKDEVMCVLRCDSYAEQVVDDYDCMLNQTNIGYNNNKYYVIQVIVAAGRYYSWNRWGRVVLYSTIFSHFIIFYL